MVGVATVTLWVHIAFGVVAVLAGTGALVTTKGGRYHRRSGKLFVASMAVVVGTVLVLVVAAPTTFRVILTLVAVFSGCLAFSGYRVLGRKRPVDGAGRVDQAAAVSVVVACLLLGGWGVVWALSGRSFGVVMFVIGSIGIAFGGLELRQFHTGSRDDWMVAHLQRMIAACIATVSAVSAVNLTPWLGVVAWRWPTIVGTPLICVGSRRYAS